MMGGCWEDDGRMIGGEWEDNGRRMGGEWEESSEIFNAVRENIRAADSRSAISRLKKWYQPTQEVVSADQMNTACRLKKTGSSGIPSDVILMHDVSMLTSLPM